MRTCRIPGDWQVMMVGVPILFPLAKRRMFLRPRLDFFFGTAISISSNYSGSILLWLYFSRLLTKTIATSVRDSRLGLKIFQHREGGAFDHLIACATASVQVRTTGLTDSLTGFTTERLEGNLKHQLFCQNLG